jgi:acetyltransferase-like isoleucine patch superfamily enzyme
LPGVKIGKGCIIGAGCILSKSVPDYSIVAGNPGEVVGETTRMDSKYFDEKIVQENYYDKEILGRYRG